MEKFISYEKLSKRKKREIDRQKRASWNGVNPTTKKIKNAKIYNRKKTQNRFDEYDYVSFLFLIIKVSCPSYQVGRNKC